jgi:hypothetical protein
MQHQTYLESLGFDKVTVVHPEDAKRGLLVSYRVGCSQCAALVINGHPTHEIGCPNQTHNCEECGVPIPRRFRRCEDCSADLESWQDGCAE